MEGRKDDSSSYDPRTWRGSFDDLAAGGAAGSPADAAPAESTSFDPRSWSADAAAAPATVRQARRATGWKIAAIAGAVVAAAAGGLLWQRRAPRPAAPAATAAGAPAAARQAERAVPGASRRTLVLADASQVAPTIASIGLAPETARTVSAQLRAGLGTAPGEIRLSYETTGGVPPRLLTAEATRDDGAGLVL